jgi:hypothetical protein
MGINLGETTLETQLKRWPLSSQRPALPHGLKPVFGSKDGHGYKQSSSHGSAAARSWPTLGLFIILFDIFIKLNK